MSDANSEKAALTCDQCPKGDLKGTIGLAMHKRRAHGANWSTKPRGTQAR